VEPEKSLSSHSRKPFVLVRLLRSFSSFLDLLWARLFSLLSRLRQTWRWPFVATWRVIKWFLQLVHDYNGAVTALATVAIVALTVAYVSYSKKQWQVARDTLEISQRSYVTIGRKDGVVASFIPSQRPEQKAQIVLYFQNGGHLPAKVAWGIMPGIGFLAVPTGSNSNQSSGITYYRWEGGLPVRMINKKSGQISEQGQPGQQTATIAGDSIFMAPIGELSAQDLKDLPTKNISTLTTGNYQYCDELGTKIMHSFWLSYQNAPSADLVFKLVRDSPSPNFFVPPRTPASTDTEYLSPCETIGEQQENQKKIQQYNSKAQRLCRWLKLCK
jgi:hypothetical protein